jgi:hypothetical protein
MALTLQDIPAPIVENLRERRNDRVKAQQPKSAWFRFTSTANPEGQENGQALMGGVFGPDSVNEQGFDGDIPAGFFGQYSFGPGEAARPEPGAMSASVSQNGDDLEFSVEWKAYTLQQIERLAPYFFTPGISVILEMGWSSITRDQLGAVTDISDLEAKRDLFRNKPKGSGEDGPVYTLNGTPKHPTIERKIRGGGNYDIYVGKIGGFNIDYNDDGSFSCTTEVTGVPQSIVALKASTQKVRVNDNEGDEKKPSLYEFVAERMGKSVSEDEPPANIDEIGRSDVGTGNWAAVGETEFLSWEAVEKQLLNKFVAYRSTEAKGQDVLNFDSSDSLASYYPELLSGDAKTCVVVPRDTIMPNGDELRGFTKNADSDSPKRGKLYNLYVSKQTIIDSLERKKNSSIADCMLDVLEKCSAACYNIWDWQVRQEGNNLKFVDRNATGIVDNQQPFEFRPFTTDSIVKSFTIETELDDLLKSEIMIGSMVSDEGRDKNHQVNGKNPGITNLFGRIEDPVMPRDKENKAEPRRTPGENAARQLVEEVGNPDKEELFDKDPTKFEELPENFGYVRIDGFKNLQATPEKAREIKQGLRKDTDEDSPVNANKNLPIDCSFELKGIGGLYKYQAFQVANIPDFLGEGLFMVKNVSHEITTDDWTTSVDGQFRTKNLFRE